MADNSITDAAANVDAPIAPVAIFKKRGAKAKANLRKRPATPPPANSDSDDSDYSSSEDEQGQRVKRRKKNLVVTASSKNNVTSQHESATVFSADRNVPITSTNDATKQSNWYDEDANLLGKTRPVPQPGLNSDTSRSAPDGTYKGMANRTTFIQKNPNAPNRTVGPIKAATNIRTITVTDFAPDVCKDYKQTGFCGFGDNCKFLHAREDYKQGWQLDRDWENVTKGKKNMGGTVVASADRDQTSKDDDDAVQAALLEKIPFACIICKKDYRSPIKTRCGHYFCEPCALQRYRKDPSCAACGAGTNGVFNAAKELSKLLDKKKVRAERLRQEAIDAGEDPDKLEEGKQK
ncbi:Pre-mRNA-splicing factor cwc24 [Pestalotiopsis fici W106-1]|uniref:Pre-mRNA-splicing factor CWC24 n=1 Tax=Pestalotiopsis fici (strain W106-1 / CGMCC3.15140) TaxID=1229662 RepID=W3XA69_PESFW|nr:Pre-mRNA-splicing factor cwc24 [Pestalotiopsis fici W106-1]ETS82071.1 Pre-mRNA-splicing factor cwc24 [Pestalotiopsis fici W106-1]